MQVSARRSSSFQLRASARDDGLFGGGGDLTGILIGFLLGQMTNTGARASSSSSRFLGIGEQPSSFLPLNGAKSVPVMAVPKETVETGAFLIVS